MFGDQPVVQPGAHEEAPRSFARTSVHPPKSFTGHVKDWTGPEFLNNGHSMEIFAGRA